MFGLGAGVGLVTMSVSVSLTILVPLVARKVVRREYVLPYIMGASLTTLADTMVAAFALDSAAAVRVLLAAVLPATAITVLLLAFAYPLLWTVLWEAQARVTRTRTRLAAFTAGVLLVPLLLLGLAPLLA
jgi:Na+/phosphate symporter